jgi:hypothetical protein
VATSLTFILFGLARISGEVNAFEGFLTSVVFTSNIVGEKIADVSGFALQSLIQSLLLK